MRLIALVLTLIAPTVNGAIITVEPDDFAIGTVLSNLIPGVTLSVEGHPGSTVRVLEGVIIDGPTAGRNLSSTGSRVFGHEVTGSNIRESDFFRIWSDGGPSPILRADFDSLTDFVSIDAIANDDDSFILKAFGSGGSLLTSVATPSFRDSGRTLTISRLAADIDFILIHGIAPEGAGLLDNFQFNQLTVPEPATLALLGIGLAGLAVRGRRRCLA